MNRFPSVKQFREVIRMVQQKARFMGLDDSGEPIINPAPKFPKLTFRGSVKLHGTNAAVVFGGDGITYQSRERVLTHDSDNAGFYNHMIEFKEELKQLDEMIRSTAEIPAGATVAVFGEWCGGNIQKSVALNGLPKMFVVFAIKANDEWLDLDAIGDITIKAASIFSVSEFDQFDIEIDFSRPEIAQNVLGSITERVEARCPVAAEFGSIGIGEGVVWRCVTDPSSEYWFKVKGEKHSATKVKTLAAVDVEAIQNLRDFVSNTVTEARLEQGLQNLVREKLKPLEISSMGDFIRWVYGDVIKEESDTISANGLDAKKLGGPIANVARAWYIERINQEAVSS